MKVILFRGGKPGEIVSLPGERPKVELSDLLGGEIEWFPLDRRMQLVTLKEGEAMQLPIRYSVERKQSGRLGAERFLVAGDCVVLVGRADGMITDAEKRDMLLADLLVEPVQ